MKQSKLLMMSLGLAMITALTACAGDKMAEPVIGDGYATANFMSVNYKGLNVVYALTDPAVSSSSEHSSCILKLDKNEIIPAYQEYLTKHLTEEELKVADELYGSELGNRINDLNLARIDAMSQAIIGGKPLAEIGKIAQEATPPSEEDKAAVKEFLATETGKKISSLTHGDLYHTDGFANYTYPQMVTSYDGCYVALPSVEEFLPMVIQMDKKNHPDS